MVKKSLISVIIPAFNRASLIGQTLRSLLAQSVPADEILVVDDGSTDGTDDIAEAFGPPIRVIRQSNSGPAAARNRGFNESIGEFVHFFDSDDIALPNKHEVQLRALVEHQADIAYGPWVKGTFTQNGFTPENLILQQQGLPKGDLLKALLTNWSIVPHACLFRRTIVDLAGGFPEDLLVAEDQLMFLNCLLAGAKVVHSPGTLELYRTGEVGKITESPSGIARRAHDWGLFLLKAKEACEAKTIYPGQWFEFRKRCWQAATDLVVVQPSSSHLIKELSTIAHGSIFSSLYRPKVTLDRWVGGLQMRVKGFRSHGSFQVGPLQLRQIKGIQELGLKLIPRGGRP